MGSTAPKLGFTIFACSGQVNQLADGMCCAELAATSGADVPCLNSPWLLPHLHAASKLTLCPGAPHHMCRLYVPRCLGPAVVQDPEHPVAGLLSKGPQAKGWHTPRCAPSPSFEQRLLLEDDSNKVLQLVYTGNAVTVVMLMAVCQTSVQVLQLATGGDAAAGGLVPHTAAADPQP